MKRAGLLLALAPWLLPTACAAIAGLQDVPSPPDAGDGSSSGSSGGADAVSDAKASDAGTACVIGGTMYASGAANPTNACESCQPVVSSSVWSDVTDGTVCGTGGICHLGACVYGCEIDGVYATTNAPNPDDACQSCQPAKSTSAWSSVADGASCGNGQVCASGQCGTQCTIAGTSYASGAANPSNACQSCQPGTSTTAWSPRSNGASCSGSGTCSSGSCALPLSCAPGGAGMTNCGSGGDGGSGESCCTSLEVAGGTYYRTYTNDGDGGTGEADPASVSGFRLDKYEVTVGRFRQFVAAWNGGAGYTPPQGSGIHEHLYGGKGLASSGAASSDGGVAYETGWDATDWSSQIAPTDTNLAACAPFSTWADPPSTTENLPINCVTWYEAYAFCIWDGGFLPSEAEWEYAAAGGTEQLEYPWGTAAPGTGDEYAIYGCNYPSGSGSCTDSSNIAPVGTATLGVGPWGQLDLAGSEWEWNLDGYATYVDPCTDCAYLSAAPAQVFRSGNFYYPLPDLLPPNRESVCAGCRDDGYYVGIRCARTP